MFAFRTCPPLNFAGLSVIAAISTLLLTGSGCSSAAPAAAEQPVPKVTVTPATSEETTDFDEYTGNTEASEIVEVRARVSGFLKTVDFTEGEFIAEGKPLFTIEPDEYDAIHKQSTSRIELNAAKRDLAKAKLDRNETLLKKQALSQEEYEESVAAYRESTAAITAAEADAERSALDVKYTVVKAPIAGRIDRALVTRGNMVTGGLGSGTLLTKIVNDQPMHVFFDVDERSLLRYMRQRAGGESESKPGDLKAQGIACFVKLADEKEFDHAGKLDFAATEVERGTGTARIRAVLENKDRALTSGMFVRVRIPIGKPYQALLIPEQALMTDQSIKFVYVVGDDGMATRRSVELGTSRGDRRIITTGLKAGDRVVVKGQQRVRPGQKVEAELQQPKPAAEPAAKTADAKS